MALWKNIEVVEHGSSMFDRLSGRSRRDYSFYGPRNYFTVGAVLKNPNTEFGAFLVKVKVTVLNADRRVLASSETTIPYIDPNASFYYGDDFAIIKDTPLRYEIKAYCDNFIKLPANSSFTKGIRCTSMSIAETDDTYGHPFRLTGRANNDYPMKLDCVSLYFVFFRDAKIVGGVNTSVGMYGNSSEPFNASMSVNPHCTRIEYSPSFNVDLLGAEVLKYKALFDQGIITQEEFSAKKKQLLGL